MCASVFVCVSVYVRVLVYVCMIWCDMFLYKYLPKATFVCGKICKWTSRDLYICEHINIPYLILHSKCFQTGTLSSYFHPSAIHLQNMKEPKRKINISFLYLDGCAHCLPTCSEGVAGCGQWHKTRYLSSRSCLSMTANNMSICLWPCRLLPQTPPHRNWLLLEEGLILIWQSRDHVVQPADGSTLSASI